MKQNIPCELIRDLLPLYVDGLTSEASNREIKEHLETCGSCRERYERMKRELEGEGVFGGLADYFISTTGTGTSTDNARRFALDFIPKLLEDQISAVILTST